MITSAKQQRRRKSGSPLPYEKGQPAATDKYGPLERHLVARGAAASVETAHSMIRDLPREYARLIQCVVDIDAARLAIIDREAEAVREGIEKRPLSPELLIQEASRDGKQNLSLTVYLQTPTTHPEKKARARTAAHDCFREGHGLLDLGHAILTTETLR